MKKLIIFLIEFYQKNFSWDEGRDFTERVCCKYEPRCSEYLKQGIVRYGIFKGMVKGAWRVIKCNPWSNGGVDEL